MALTPRSRKKLQITAKDFSATTMSHELSSLRITITKTTNIWHKVHTNIDI